MSDRYKSDSAKRAGKKAYWSGIKIDENPMKAADSRASWHDGWREEEAEHEARKRILSLRIENER